MPKVKLYNVAGEAAGEIELNDSVFGVDYNEAVIRHTCHQNQRPCTRRRQEALETEGHRPCQSRIHPLPTVGRWWYRIRTDPEKPCQRYAEKGTSAGCKICTV